MIEKDFDVPFVAQLAQQEKQIQQHYRPVIGVHKWFARRPGTLFRALLLAEFTIRCFAILFLASAAWTRVCYLSGFPAGIRSVETADCRVCSF